MVSAPLKTGLHTQAVSAFVLNVEGRKEKGGRKNETGRKEQKKGGGGEGGRERSS